MKTLASQPSLTVKWKGCNATCATGCMATDPVRCWLLHDSSLRHHYHAISTSSSRHHSAISTPSSRRHHIERQLYLLRHAAARLLLDQGVESILQFTCRDKNRIALQGDLLGASALGLSNIMCMGGDPPTIGDSIEV